MSADGLFGPPPWLGYVEDDREMHPAVAPDPGCYGPCSICSGQGLIYRLQINEYLDCAACGGSGVTPDADPNQEHAFVKDDVHDGVIYLQCERCARTHMRRLPLFARVLRWMVHA